MSINETGTVLIPPPPVVREQLAKNLREASLLRSLLRLSIRADQERFRQEDGAPPAGPKLGRA